ncbi:MAG: hypothetical protein GY925_03325 [Actinomycetia bacterium]|nr:hypothetical protein [Actinomycetes bacterium]
MILGVGGLIGCGTRFISLEPGDIIATGTRDLGTLRDGASSDRRGRSGDRRCERGSYLALAA